METRFVSLTLFVGSESWVLSPFGWKSTSQGPVGGLILLYVKLLLKWVGVDMGCVLLYSSGNNSTTFWWRTLPMVNSARAPTDRVLIRPISIIRTGSSKGFCSEKLAEQSKIHVWRICFRVPNKPVVVHRFLYLTNVKYNHVTLSINTSICQRKPKIHYISQFQFREIEPHL